MYGFPIQDILSEGKVGHIGSKPWCINSEELQGTDGKSIDVVICIQEESPLQPSLLLRRDLQVDQFRPGLENGKPAKVARKQAKSVIFLDQHNH